MIATTNVKMVDRQESSGPGSLASSGDLTVRRTAFGQFSPRSPPKFPLASQEVDPAEMS